MPCGDADLFLSPVSDTTQMNEHHESCSYLHLHLLLHFNVVRLLDKVSTRTMASFAVLLFSCDEESSKWMVEASTVVVDGRFNEETSHNLITILFLHLYLSGLDNLIS